VRGYIYVGMATPTLALLQHKTRLLLVDLTTLSTDMFYQQVMRTQRQQEHLALLNPRLLAINWVGWRVLPAARRILSILWHSSSKSS
jgi:DNA mismatch repair protein Mlh1 C-terminus